MPAMADQEGGKGLDAKAGTARSDDALQSAGNSSGELQASLPNSGDAAAQATSALRGAASETLSQNSAPPPAAGAPTDKITVLGHAAWLMSHSPLHRYFFLADLEWMLVPPVAQQQFRLWMGQGRPEGFATWALVDDAVEARLKAGHKRLAPNEWTCGPHLWLMDLVAPFGGADNALTDLKAALQGRSIKTMRLNPETQKMEVVEL